MFAILYHTAWVFLARYLDGSNWEILCCAMSLNVVAWRMDEQAFLPTCNRRIEYE